MSRLSVGTSKPFAKGDVVVYLVVAVVIALLCVVVFVPKPQAMQRVEVYYQNDLVYAYDCTTGRGQAYAVEGVQVKIEGDLVAVETQRGTNTLSFAPDKVYMQDADCKGKDCVESFEPLTKGGQVLVCMPHALRVVAVGRLSNEVVV